MLSPWKGSDSYICWSAPRISMHACCVYNKVISNLFFLKLIHVLFSAYRLGEAIRRLPGWSLQHDCRFEGCFDQDGDDVLVVAREDCSSTCRRMDRSHWLKLMSRISGWWFNGLYRTWKGSVVLPFIYRWEHDEWFRFGVCWDFLFFGLDIFFLRGGHSIGRVVCFPINCAYLKVGSDFYVGWSAPI